jgi:hypothetical protein
MKQVLIAVIFLCAALPSFSQRVSSVVIHPFEAQQGVSVRDADSLREQVIRELSSWGSIIVLNENEADSADYYAQVQVLIEDSTAVLIGITFDAAANKPLNSYREQAADINALSERIFSFCSLLAEFIPLPNFLPGKWISTVDMNDGPLTCILEFRSNRTVTVERYDTYERRGGNALTYQGIGSGTYAYSPQIRRTVSLRDPRGESRSSPVDGAVSINLALEDVLPRYTNLATNRISLVFSDNRDRFELLTAGFPCGENFDGVSFYPYRSVIYTLFTKIQ